MNISLVLLLLLVPSLCSALQLSSRRGAFFAAASAATAACSTIASPAPAWALDMDAFMSKELSKTDTKRDMTADEGLCKYGEPAQRTGEACVRAGMSTKRTDTLDAFGKVDRGDFIRCKTYYDDMGDRYQKRVVCE